MPTTMCKGSSGGGTQQVTSTNSPDPQLRADYQNVVNRAQGNADTPLTQYSGPMVAGFTPAQMSAFNTVNNAQGVADPYINTAAGFAAAGTTPVTPAAFSGQAVQQYMSPYTQNVVDTTRANIDESNAEQQQGVVGNAISKGAWGGDRAGIAQSELARQQKLAEDQTIAGLQNQGYAQGLGEFNTQQQVGVGAQEAQNWLAENASSQFGALGNEALNTTLSGANAQLAAGQQQQQQAQSELNIPYEQFLQRQAYPFQTTNYLAGITEGIGGQSGGTATTTSPAPSTGAQAAGLGLGALGLVGGTGGFGSGGWLSKLFASGGRTRTALSPHDEEQFQSWYADMARRARLDPDVDAPEHHYDMRGAWQSGALGAVDPDDNRLHFPSEYKDDDHPNRFIDRAGGTLDTKYGVQQGFAPGGHVSGDPWIDGVTFIPDVVPHHKGKGPPDFPRPYDPADPLAAAKDIGRLGLKPNNTPQVPYDSGGAEAGAAEAAANGQSAGAGWFGGDVSGSVGGFGDASEAAGDLGDLGGFFAAAERRGGRIGFAGGGDASFEPWQGGAGAPGGLSPLITGFLPSPGRGIPVPLIGGASNSPLDIKPVSNYSPPAGPATPAAPTDPGGGGTGMTPIGLPPESGGTGDHADGGGSSDQGGSSPSDQGPTGEAPGTPAGTNTRGSLTESNASLAKGAIGLGLGLAMGNPLGIAKGAIDLGKSLFGAKDQVDAIDPVTGAIDNSNNQNSVDNNNNAENATGMQGVGSTEGSGQTEGASGAMGGPGGSTGGNGVGSGTGATGPGGGENGGGHDSDGGGGDGDGGGGDGCFVGTTPVLMADHTLKPISDVTVGDMVMAFAKLGPLQPRAVTAKHVHGPRLIMLVEGVGVTPEHPFLREDGHFLPAGDLKPGTVIITAAGLNHVVREVDLNFREAPVFNLTVDDLHTYVAGGYRVHNSKWRGGTVRRRHRDDGGSVDGLPSPTMAAGPMAQNSYEHYAKMPAEQLQELSQRLPQMSRYGQMVRHALAMKHIGGDNATATQAATPQAAQAPQGFAAAPQGFAVAPTPTGGAALAVGGFRSGGRAGFADGGDAFDDDDFAPVPVRTNVRDEDDYAPVPQRYVPGMTLPRGFVPAQAPEQPSPAAVRPPANDEAPYRNPFEQFEPEGKHVDWGKVKRAVLTPPALAIDYAARNVGRGAPKETGEDTGVPSEVGFDQDARRFRRETMTAAPPAPLSERSLSPTQTVGPWQDDNDPRRAGPGMGATAGPRFGRPEMEQPGVAGFAPVGAGVRPGAPRPGFMPASSVDRPAIATSDTGTHGPDDRDKDTTATDAHRFDSIPPTSLAAKKGATDATSRNIAQSPWLALAAAGFGMAASRNPQALGAAGEGALHGVKTIQEQQVADLKQQSIDNEKQYREDAIAARKQGYELEAKKLDQLAGQHRDTLAESRREHDLVNSRMIESNRLTNQYREDSLAAGRYTYQAGTGPDENGLPVTGFWKLPTKGDEAPTFHAGDTLTGRGQGGPGQTERIIATLRKENPDLTEADAVSIARRAPNNDMITLRKEALAVTRARATAKSPSGNPTEEEIESARQKYGLAKAPAAAATAPAAAAAAPGPWRPEPLRGIKHLGQSDSTGIYKDLDTGKLYDPQGNPL